MSAHLAIERLSAYLDQELDGRSCRQVEAHVLECPPCQRRLHGLRRVVDELQRMPTVSAPPRLGRAFEREASARWRERRDQAFRGGQPQSGFDPIQGLILLGSALVVGAAVVAMTVAHGIARDGAGGTRLVLPSVGAVVPSAERLEAGGRVFVLADGVWWQQDLLAGGRVTHSPQLAVRSAQEAVARAPWLEQLLGRGPVVLELDGEPVVVEPAAGAGR